MIGAADLDELLADLVPIGRDDAEATTRLAWTREDEEAGAWFARRAEAIGRRMERDPVQLARAEGAVAAHGVVLRGHLLERPRDVRREDDVHDVLPLRARGRRDRVHERDGPLQWHIDALGTDATGVQRRIKADAVPESIFANALFGQTAIQLDAGVAVQAEVS